MYDDLKENIILVMQHPIARRPISNLSDEEREKAFDLLNYLSTLSVDENYTPQIRNRPHKMTQRSKR